MITKNSNLFTAKPETCILIPMEIPQRHQEANCFHCGEQNHTNKR